jgi:hypothetical protein
MTIENEELDEQSLFNQTVGDEPAETPEVPAAEIEQPEKPEGEVVAEAETPAGKPVVDDNAPLVPSWRLREINEEKRTLADRLAALEAEKATWQTTKPATDAPKPEKTKPDPLLDPEGYEKSIEEKIEARLINSHREMDLRLTRSANTEVFDKAYAESQRLKAAGDPDFLELSQKMHSTNAPGKVLLDWYQQRSVKQEIGGDLNAYKARLREEALKDPEFRKAAIEAWRTDAQTQPSNGRPRVELPPSLSGSSRANAVLKSDNEEVSDHELFAAVTG